jgi:hypothetical protein
VRTYTSKAASTTVNVRLRNPAQKVFLGQPLDQMVDAAGITPTVISIYSLIALHCATLAAYRYENMIVSRAERVSKRKSRELAETGRGFKWRHPRGSPREGAGRLSHRCWLEPIVSQPSEIRLKAL